MAYQSLYRKYRPQTFADVVGQGHVTRTIQNALASGRVGHGYLFTGTRGTAKTTVARLLAKALNCQSSPVPTPEPCNRCEACRSITAGSCIDVIEMDAASHRGVADIEEVRKSVGYGPMEMRFKVFIIDEAHQLSSDAKDAFLKTLEEPPANVVFVLATTEPQAIPITIRSRCQQFDFKRGSLRDIAARLQYVLDCEGVTYAPDAINLVARGAEGSYRDSLSLLEQVLAFSPTHVSGADVDTVLGTLDAEALAQVTGAVAGRDAPTAFALAGELLDAGKEARTLLRTLSAHFRDLLLVTIGGPAVAAELTPEEVSRLQQEQQVCRFTPPMLLRAMELLNEAQGETRWNNQHRLLIELTFLKLMTLDPPAVSGTAPPAVPVFATAPIVFSTRQDTPAPIRSEPVSIPPVPTAAVPVPSTPLVAPPPSSEASPEIASELPPGFFADDPAEDDGIADDEFGEDTETPSLFGEAEETTPAGPFAPVAGAGSDPLLSASASLPPVSLTEPETSAYEQEDDEESVPFLTDDDAPFVAEQIVLPPVEASLLPSSDSDLLLPDSVTIAEPAALITPLAEPSILFETEAKEEKDEGILISIDHVRQVWPRFLAEAGKISKQTEVMMSQAFPTETHRNTILVTFSARMNLDRMNEPPKQQFVRQLLARCLGVKSVVVRFVLDENASPAPTRVRGEKKALKRDPMAQLL
ncbi:MAG: DNA polymerase III subunit gamma/tau, partial [Cytophagales bacterium]|nr:DNA polymerase III subunit gamma/tau [Armatimonadota bacterium]